MDFDLVLKLLVPRLRRARVRYAITGGVAVGIHAEPRTTQDLDLLVHRDDLAAVDRILVHLGYERFQLLRLFSRYDGPADPFGGVDLQHASTPGLVAMLHRTARWRRKGLSGSLAVVSPEDLIGLKALAIANNPRRRHKDYRDMVEVARAAGKKLKWTLVSRHFKELNKSRWIRMLKRDVRP